MTLTLFLSSPAAWKQCANLSVNFNLPSVALSFTQVVRYRPHRDVR